MTVSNMVSEPRGWAVSEPWLATRIPAPAPHLGAHDVPRVELLVLGVAVQRELHLVREPQGEALLHLAEVEKHAALALAALAAFLLLTALIIPALLGLQAGLLGAWGGIGWGGILVVSLGLGARLPGVICFRWLRRRAVLRRRPLPALLRCGGFLFSRTIRGLSSQLLATCVIGGLLHAGRLGGIRAAGHGGEARRCRDIGLSAFLLSLLVRLRTCNMPDLVACKAKSQPKAAKQGAVQAAAQTWGRLIARGLYSMKPKEVRRAATRPA